jgi:hypothetical protein
VPPLRRFDPWFNFRATQYLFDNGICARPPRRAAAAQPRRIGCPLLSRPPRRYTKAPTASRALR